MRLTVATKITLIRMLMIPFVATSILYRRYGLALLLFLISGLSDLFDGFVARKFHQKSRLGALLDPMADKLLLSTSFVLLTIPSTGVTISIPLWLTVIVFGRDILIVASAVAIALTTGFTKFDPSIYGKASTVVQIACVLGVLMVNYLRAYQAVLVPVFYITFVLTLFSGFHYVYVFSKRFNMETEEAVKKNDLYN